MNSTITAGNYLSRTLHVVISTEYRVRRCQYTRSRVQDSRDTGFGDGNGLLLHRFVDRYSILVSHLVEFVDADHTAIGKHHGTAFQVEFPLKSGNDQVYVSGTQTFAHTVLLSRCTEAVRPAADEPFPDV